MHERLKAVSTQVRAAGPARVIAAGGIVVAAMALAVGLTLVASGFRNGRESGPVPSGDATAAATMSVAAEQVTTPTNVSVMPTNVDDDEGYASTSAGRQTTAVDTERRHGGEGEHDDDDRD